MGIADKAPRGGLAEELAGQLRQMRLTNTEIEQFEDHHRGIFDVRDAFFNGPAKPTAREVRDLVAYGLSGAGMAPRDADVLVGGLGPDQNHRLYSIAQALVGVAFYPDAADAFGGDAPADPAPAEDPEKKTDPAPGVSGA